MTRDEQITMLADNLRIANAALEKVAGYRLADDAVVHNPSIAYLAAALTKIGSKVQNTSEAKTDR